MKKIYVLSLLLFLVKTGLFSQGWEWRVPADQNSMIKNQSDQIYAYKFYNQSFSLKKYDTDGTALWSKNIPAVTWISAVRLDPSDNLLILGNLSATIYIDSDSIVPNGPENFFLLRISPSGAIIQKQVFGQQERCVAYALNFAFNGDCYLGGGFTDSISINGTMLYGDTAMVPFFVRLDPSGNVLWAETGTLTTSGEAYVHEIAETSSGNLFVGFSMMGLLNFKGYQFNHSGQYLCYLGPLRTILAEDFLTYFSYDHFHPHDLRTNGEKAYMKNIWSHHGCSGEMNVWDAQGNYKGSGWGGSGIGYDIFNGKVYASLFSYDDCNFPTAKWRNFLQLSDSLTVISQHVDSMPVSSYGWDSGLEMIDTSSFYIIGYEDGFGNFLGKYNLSISAGIHEDADSAPFILYPNPVVTDLVIKNINPKGEQISIYNPLGGLVYRKSFKDNAAIDLSSFAPSAYIIEISGKRKIFIKQ
jgi:hypothetical protein